MIDVSDYVALIRARVGQPGLCHCTGACLKDETRCPAYGHEQKTFNQLVEEAAVAAECFDNPARAAALRAAKDPP